MSVRFTLDADDSCTCGNAYGDLNFNMSHPLIVRPEYIMTKDKLTYTDSNYNSGSESISSYSRAVDDGATQRLNGWKIFAAVILQAWRRRRKQVKETVCTIEKLTMESACSKSQLQVYSTLIQVEQKRNEELTCQLKRTLSNLNRSKSSCETMSATLISMKADKSLLEQELKVKYEEYDALHSVLAQTKTDLFRSMMETRNLQSQLCNEQRSLQALETQKNQLINEICDLNAETRQMEETFKRQFEEKQQQLNEMKEKLKVLQPTLVELKEKLNTQQMHQNEEEMMTDEVKKLRMQVLSLQDELNGSLSSRLRLFWDQFVSYQMSTFRYVHTVAYYLMPATPPPPMLRCKTKKV